MKSITNPPKRKSNKRQGFTLVELIVVIVIILILSAVLVPQVLRYITRAQKAVCAENKHVVYLHSAAAYTDGTYSTLEEAFNSLYDNEKESCPSGGTYTIVMADDGYSGQIICSVHDDNDNDGNDNINNDDSNNNDNVNNDDNEEALDPVKNFMVGDFLVNVDGKLEDHSEKSIPGGMILYHKGDYYFTRNQTWISLNNITSSGDVVKINSTTPVEASKAKLGDFSIINGQLYVYSSRWNIEWKPVNAIKQN